MKQWVLLTALHDSTTTPIELYCTLEVAGLFLMKGVEGIDKVLIWNLIDRELGVKVDKWWIRPSWHVVHVLPPGHEPPADWQAQDVRCCIRSDTTIDRYMQRV